MITRIKIDGFKSLLGAELYFGPFTCIAGANAAGKSNLFDAIVFLANLADMTILEAAKSIRSEEGKHSDIRDVFFKSADRNHDNMSFEIDMLVPETGIDDLGQTAIAKITSLRYKLRLKLNRANNSSELPIEIIEEWLEPMTRDAAKKSTGFYYDEIWLSSVLKGKRSGDFISTEEGKIKLHQDTKDQDRSRGRAAEFIANKMPRTLLSTVTAESPTAFIARQEMRNWQMLQFEPVALRQPNSFHEIVNSRIEADGYNLPATLYRLATDSQNNDVYQQLTNTLKGVVDDVKIIGVDKDDKRELLTLMVTFKNGLTLPAQSLSDGTLRFLGLAVIQEDSRNGVICMEEPENGINPKKISEIVSLLRDMALDPELEVGDDNPIRQVIINTHSPKLIGIVPENSLYLACDREKYDDSLGMKVHYTSFSVLPNTYLLKEKRLDFPATSLYAMFAYLDNPRPTITDLSNRNNLSKRHKKDRHYTVQDNINELFSSLNTMQ
jgi:predicted ATPase